MLRVPQAFKVTASVSLESGVKAARKKLQNLVAKCPTGLLTR